LADEAYSTRADRHLHADRGITEVTPQPAGRYGAAGPQLRRRSTPRLRRHPIPRPHIVERSYALMKQRRGLATRYDKHATIYRATALLHTVEVDEQGTRGCEPTRHT
jgi:hypothetical protein